MGGYIMRLIVCAIAKYEDNYIRDFCNYHLNLGFDEIHVYDNSSESQLSSILSDIPQVVIHPWVKQKYIHSPQMDAYHDCIDNVEYDWCAFIDVDEFITLNGFTNISDFLKTFNQDVQCIHLYEEIYGDGGKIIPDDISLPVYNRILKPSRKYIFSYTKNIVKKDAIGKFKNPHLYDKDLPAVNSHGINETGKFFRSSRKKIVDDKAYIRHYKTKTLSEFCDQKLNTPRVFDPTKKRTIDYFFQVNKKTPEKIAYLKSRGIEA
jgi:hypothetical protein